MQMECDSAHSATESALGNRDVYRQTDRFQNVALTRKIKKLKQLKQNTKQLQYLKQAQNLDWMLTHVESTTSRLGQCV